MKRCATITGVLFLLAGAVHRAAAWDPANADWSKSNPADVRVMTWNVKDSICSSNNKAEAITDWSAIAHIVAGLRPDVLILQETADNEGQGTGDGVDSVATMEDVVDLLLHGGTDTYNNGDPEVGSYVQLFAPEYDLPYVFVGSITDGFNRNVILSRLPFVDLNGDTKGTYNDIPFLIPDEYAPGGGGGIRGFLLAELDLPDERYSGDLVVGNAHLKSGSTQDDIDERREAAQNTAYVIDYWYNGAGGTMPDPNGAIFDAPAATSILDDHTPVVIGGDWNEDELFNGRKGPAEWLTQAEVAGGTDGTDRDRTDMTYDSAVHVFTGDRDTIGSSKFDYVAWQDSIAGVRRQFTFNTTGTAADDLPPELDGYGLPTLASSIASDHLPVIVDLTLPLRADSDADGDVGLSDYVSFRACLVGPGLNFVPPSCEPYNINEDLNVDLLDVAALQRIFTGE